jgi:hypothetical protein
MLREGKRFTILHGQPEIVFYSVYTYDSLRSTLLLLKTYTYIGSGFKPKSDPLSVIGGVTRDCGGFKC